MRKWRQRSIAPEMAPPGPAMFDFEDRVAATADEIYALLDFADPRNAKRALGHEVVSTGPGTFRFTMVQMPETPFAISVDEAVPGRSYVFRARPERKVGRLQWSEERYSLAPQADGSCLVTQLVAAQFDEPMPIDEYAEHIARMAQGCSLALGKLKLHAEQGTEAVARFEAAQFA